MVKENETFPACVVYETALVHWLFRSAGMKLIFVDSVSVLFTFKQSKAGYTRRRQTHGLHNSLSHLLSLGRHVRQRMYTYSW